MDPNATWNMEEDAYSEGLSKSGDLTGASVCGGKRGDGVDTHSNELDDLFPVLDVFVDI